MVGGVYKLHLNAGKLCGYTVICYKNINSITSNYDRDIVK